MKQVKILVYIYAIFFSLLNINTSDGQGLNALNIVVILDTSDRVAENTHPGQMERDIAIIGEIINQFATVANEHIDNSDGLEYDDYLTVVVPGQPTVAVPGQPPDPPPIPLKITSRLTIEDPKDANNPFTSLADIRTDLEDQKQALLDELPKVYAHVQQYRQTGSDIWEWFVDEAQDYFSKDAHNLIICISDGYLDFDRSIREKRDKGTYMEVEKFRGDPDWEKKIRNSEGLSSGGKDFSPYNVKFLMTEIDLRHEKGSGAPYQEDFGIIKVYWETWLNAMGIKETDFIKQGRPLQTLRRKIQSFISIP